MENLIWQQNYSVGVEYFDNQHKKLFATAQKLYQEIMSSKSESVIREILEDLLHYVDTHFKDEEFYMEKYNYDYLEKHKKEHRQFEEEIHNLKGRHQEGQIFIAMKLLNYLQDWFFDHIVMEDQKYGSLLNDKEIRSVSDESSTLRTIN